MLRALPSSSARLQARCFSYLMPSKPLHYYQSEQHGHVIPVVNMIESTQANPFAKLGTLLLTPFNGWITFSLFFSFSTSSIPAVLPALSFLAHPLVLAPSVLAQLAMSAYVLSRRFDHHIQKIYLKPCGTRMIVMTWKGKEMDLPIAGIQSFQLIRHLSDSMLFYYNGETFLLGGAAWAKSVYNSELVRGVLLGMGVDLSMNPIKRDGQYLRNYLPKTMVYKVEELRPIYRERYPDKVKKIKVPLTPDRVKRLWTLRRLMIPKRARRNRDRSREMNNIYGDLAVQRLEKLEPKTTLIL